MTFAMVFPGQGSQSVGMLADLSDTFPQIKVTYQEASDVLGYDLDISGSLRCFRLRFVEPG